ncbi:MAG: alpha/beta fold hydrolase [Bacteroidota bacterium]
MRLLLSLLTALAVGYVLLAGFVAMMQGRMLYPSAGQGPAPDPAVLSALRYEVIPGVAAPRALIAEPEGEARATVVVFHGNGGTAMDRGYYARALTARGVRVVLAEYPGYGGRPGTPTEAALVTDAAETIRAIYQQHGGPLVVWGESLGAGVAAAVLPETSGMVDGVVLLTPWDSLVETARGAFPWLPVRLLLRERYDSVAHLGEFAGPVAVLVAERDKVIPAERGLALYEALDEPKRLWTFEGAGHNSWPSDPDEAWWDGVMRHVLMQWP